MSQSETTGNWREVGPQAYVLPTGKYLLNVGLVVGVERALVIDTGAGPHHGTAILEAVRTMTDLPLVVANTHSHFDHFFGNAVFAAAGASEFWAHEACAADIAATGEEQRSFVAEAEPEMAAGTEEDTVLVVPEHTVGEQPVTLDLGGLSVELFHLGRGHTDNDLLVGLDTVVFAGDLIEEGADPAFEDAFPQEWVHTLERLVRLRKYETFVPGHGSPVGSDYVRVQASTMSRAIRIATQARREAPSDTTKAIPIMPYAPEHARALMGRLT
ncbi:MBL fold metallo-hydrolase [Arthrobacter monumenti]